MDGVVRVRSAVWVPAAVVLTLVCALLATQPWSADAAPGDEDATVVPVTPCRLFDFRPGESPAGGKKTPLAAGAANAYTQQVTGNVGNCSIPAGAVAVAMNVTITDPTAQSNLRIYPANVTTVPLVSSLNWLPGQSPTPNKVDVKLSPSGEITLQNLNGTVNVLADVVGYYTNTSLRELVERLTLAESKIAALENAQPFAVTGRDNEETVTDTDEIVVTVQVTAPVAGRVVVNSATTAFDPDADDDVRCSITNSAGAAIDANYLQIWESAGINGDVSQLAGTRLFNINSGATVTYKLVCDAPSVTSTLRDSVLTAIFTPAP